MSLQDYEDEMDQYYNKWLTAKAQMQKQAARIEALETALREIAGLGVICASDMAIIALRDDRAALEERA